jgi:hypothetical protein
LARNHGVDLHALDQKPDVDVVLGGMFARHVSNMEIALLMDVVEVEARSVEGV